MTEFELRNFISEKYGAVTRARNCFLYTKKGVRLTDLYQAGGRAILGWGCSDAFTRFKNMLSRGLTGFFKTEYDSQLERVVSELLESKRKLMFFQDKVSAIKASVSFSKENASFYIPWASEAVSYKNVGAVIIEPPLSWINNIFILAVKDDVFTESAAAKVSAQIFLPGCFLSALARAFYNLIAALKEREEKDFFLYDKVLTKYWVRKGPYLFPKIAENKYDDFVKLCLDCNLVISPDYNTPSIVPFGADKGVFTKLKKLELEKDFYDGN